MIDTIRVRLVFETEFMLGSASERSEVLMSAVRYLQEDLDRAKGELDPTRAVFKEVIVE